MNIKELIIPVSLALITTWSIQYFFLQGRSTNQACDNYSFIAHKRKPLNTEIDFSDEKRSAKIATLSEVETSWGVFTFSTDGASLERLLFKRQINRKEQLLGTIFPHAESQKEERCFLVGFNEKTPYFYTLQERSDNEDTIQLNYQAAGDFGTIRKTFIIHKHRCKIDLVLSISPNVGITITPRVFYSSPIVPSLAEDVISALIMYGPDTFEKINREKLQEERGWIEPSLFGTENRYFVHAMVQDAQGFAERAYYKFVEKKNLFSILEGQAITEAKEWTLAFYFGPKESESINAVDPRLEKSLDYYGWFSWLSKGMLYLLNLLYSYVHNYGLAIIILTTLIRLLLLPFTWRSEQGMKQRLEVQKKLTYVQQRYKDEPEMLARERAEIIRKNGMSGLGSCLPLLLQLPLFFALSRVLSHAIELYQAPMLWISDLSAKDPYYILPVLVCISMLAQALHSDAQQRMSMIIMAFVFGAITASFSAGLALYICVSTILGVLQSRLFALLSRVS